MTQEPDEEQKAKKKYTIKIITITIITMTALFLLIILFSREHYQEKNNAYISNLTNTSIVQGYLTGYQVCQENMINMINQSTQTCQLIRANISGVPIELIPTSCINK